MHGAIRTRQIRTKIRKRAMNGMAYQTKMGKTNQTRGQAVVQTNGTNIAKEVETIVHPHQNHRKYSDFKKDFHAM